MSNVIKVKQKGDFKKSERFFRWVVRREYEKFFKQVGELGVKALQDATPKDTGKTAASWTYEIENNSQGMSIVWSNFNTNKGVNIAILIQFGHGTGTGAYIQGVDYINPALKPVFEAFAKDIEVEVKKNAYN